MAKNEQLQPTDRAAILLMACFAFAFVSSGLELSEQQSAVNSADASLKALSRRLSLEQRIAIKAYVLCFKLDPRFSNTTSPAACKRLLKDIELCLKEMKHAHDAFKVERIRHRLLFLAAHYAYLLDSIGSCKTFLEDAVRLLAQGSASRLAISASPFMTRLACYHLMADTVLSPDNINQLQYELVDRILMSDLSQRKVDNLVWALIPISAMSHNLSWEFHADFLSDHLTRACSLEAATDFHWFWCRQFQPLVDQGDEKIVPLFYRHKLSLIDAQLCLCLKYERTGREPVDVQFSPFHVDSMQPALDSLKQRSLVARRSMVRFNFYLASREAGFAVPKQEHLHKLKMLPRVVGTTPLDDIPPQVVALMQMDFEF
eukprot:TRINITY_DN27094_c0_g1_i1.p1 TRINITY_DN27094_c0_g1~~TRINITY_DN27094_c0_g1_i1.p1  ORF type:complete len:399 (+),score=75.24 TRINITY_DN27094_c0_g1_i1:79-1197(+)